MTLDGMAFTLVRFPVEDSHDLQQRPQMSQWLRNSSIAASVSMSESVVFYSELTFSKKIAFVYTANGK